MKAERQKEQRLWRRRGWLPLLLGMALIVTLLPAESLRARAAESVFTFTDSEITAAEVDSDAYKIDGTELTIKASGTYVLTGSCEDGGVTVKKGTSNVTLVLRNLTLGSTEGAPIVFNKQSTGSVVVLEGTNTLTDKEDPADEDSADEAAADAFEGACLKIKAGGDLTLRGSGTLILDGSACKNGLKSGDEDTDNSLAGAPVTIESGTYQIKAANDGIHCYILTIKDGSFTVAAGDDGIKADMTLSIGDLNGATSPLINITKAYEGLEGAYINLYSGVGTITTEDDGINAANGDLNQSTTDFFLRIYGGAWEINATNGDGLDSNGDLILYNGTVDVTGSANGGNGALDYGDRSQDVFEIYSGTMIGLGSDMPVYPTSGTYVQFGGSTGMSMGTGAPGQTGGFGGGTAPGQNTGMGGQQPGRGQTGTQSSVSIKKGDTVTVKNESGTTLYETTAKQNASYVFFTTESLRSGESYDLYINGTKTVSATAGAGGSAQPGGQPATEPAGPAPGEAEEGGSSTDTSATIMYRLYNTSTYEHLYTKDVNEKNVLSASGWSYEGIAWLAANTGDPVYRLYNPNNGDHHYTMDVVERDHLSAIGWRYEGIGWYSNGGTPVYRLYNPNVKTGAHHYTTDANERLTLLQAGWVNEGIGWYAQ